MMPDLHLLTLGLGTTFALMLLVMWHRNPDGFDVRHLLTDSKTQRVSLRKVGQLTALAITTWALIRETQHDRLTEWLFFGYCTAWVSANLGSKWLEQRDKKEQE